MTSSRILSASFRVTQSVAQRSRSIPLAPVPRAFIPPPSCIATQIRLCQHHANNDNMSAPAAPAGEVKEVKPQAPVAAPADQVKQQNKKEKKEKKEKKGGISELSPPPEYFEERIKIFDEYMAKYQDFVAKQPREPITVTLPDGKQIQGTAWETTPLEIAKGISSSLADRTVIAKVNNQQLWDLTRPLEGSCNLALLDFDSPEGDYEARQVFWHSSAHVMGEACERSFEGCCLGYGPPLPEGGFFYDMSLGNDKTIGQDDYKQIEEISKKAVKEKQPFQRLELPKEVLLQMFKYNKYKQHYINEKVPDGTSSTVYRCGPLIDLCLGPHVPHTGRIKSLAVTKNSSSYFLGDAKNDSFQRVYGMSFPDSKQMTEWKKLQEEAAKRDHRKIAKDQELFFFSDLSPGSPFMLPHGMRIYNTLMKFIREEYHKRGFVEVGSPNMFNSKLWETSGHWQHYAKDMFTLKVEEDTFALKPMNCPGHCVIFDSRDRSYKELPLRLAEFGVLHRNEASGALSGMTRVRRFVQDDAHIFCTVDQIEEELYSAIDFLDAVYKPFGFEYKVGLSTRNPEKWMGDLAVWDKAEAALKGVLEAKVPGKWHINEADAAFYGPKLDFDLTDALGRKWQCGTIQLDFQLPERFNLQYRGAEASKADQEVAPGELQPGYHRPVMIHRAILGSLERFLAIITENCAGKWPFWLNPRQVVVIPVAAPFKQYSEEVAKAFKDADIHADVDLTDNTLNKKIRNAQIAQASMIIVVGEEEQKAHAVNIRNRDAADPGRGEVIPLDVAVKKLVELRDSRERIVAL